MATLNETFFYHAFDFERNFDVQQATNWMEKNWKSSFFYVSLYLVLVFGGRAALSNQKPRDVRVALVLWNLAFAFFSIAGTLRTVPELLYALRVHGFDYSVCDNSFLHINKVTRLWAWMFNISKVFELGDTFFIVLKKQKLVFLHWSHHVLTFLYCWYTYKDHNSTGRWFVCMNFAVHAVMYTYFALKSMRYSLPKWVSMVITASQILQMIVGCYVSIHAYLKLSKDNMSCSLTQQTATLSLAMYFYYVVVFCNFFYRSYFSTKKFKPLKKDS